jgi:hypothetical protein
MKFSLIVPVSADSPEYKSAMPYVFNLNKEGIMLCVKSITGLNLQIFDNIYFTILSSHDERYYIKSMLEFQFKRLGMEKAKVVVLEKPTKSQAETIFKTIEKEGIEGSIFIKDADGYFESDIVRQNSVAIFPIESMQVINPQNKSYVAVDDMFYITNIIEKKVISHEFNAGGYCFENVDDFVEYYKKVNSMGSKIYLSHIIYSMLLDRYIFRPQQVENFKDWGNNNLYKYFNS